MTATVNWQERINPVVRAIPPSGIRRFFDLATEMKGVISLGVGEPDFVTPWHIREACVYSLEKGYTMYTSNNGLLELREEIARDLAETYRVFYNPKNEILITVGVSEGLDLALRTLLSPGDEVLIPEPSYVSYAPCITLAGGRPVYLKTSVDNGFQVTAEMVEKAVTPATKVLLLCYPNNPTGATISRKNLMEIAEVVVARDLLVISDEIYEKLTYIGEHTCVPSLPGMRDRTILLNGFSKSYAMTGWRVGYAAGNPDFIAAMRKIHQYTMLCAPITAQMAALEALRNGKSQMKKMVEQYNRRRRLVLHAFQELGLPCFEPGGAFYAFPEIRQTGLSSEEFAEQLLKEARVAVVPGSAFGEQGEGHIRCSYAASIDDLNEAFKRMKLFLKRRMGRRTVLKGSFVKPGPVSEGRCQSL
ncbi:MAG TPA: aminotransferase class I/II-fold pyridoxal phosphate-dependent enzyme [Bacillota bacterium]|jgi:aminotransferase|nr:aminotransferase class I/II-fold pyridoxal phosphate-dependent enzyme [Peptococcaceae bacterium MAG4]NLW37687.1 aminotransferase class I/II-fold pyridoxal phosphate-dependent enzyme [Peptococcaceae bacterium]HPZ42754.1 aminotransferase class I/II-fold pyridoxal phosphate-dependent enzyme [Bacillota bacterium]HQD75455.1 aminotransferase class I/II-fold pyridoxal phosphate-dependent enzyme [Bacillota bacterium]HUM59107.1 aminotransferase class I/II-fold pyridoxal phosphate-dependent enzyme [Ba